MISLRNLSGYICIAIIKVIRNSPVSITYNFLKTFLPFYIFIRPGQVFRIRRLLRHSPFHGQISIGKYYHTRLWILLKLLRSHSRHTLPDRLEIVNRDIFISALETGGPVVLLGLHMGTFELLHRLPYPECSSRNRKLFVVTAPAFSQVLTAYMNQGREAQNKYITSNRSLFKTIRAVIRENGILAVMADQSPVRQNSRLTLWNKISVPFDPGILETMLKEGAAVIPVSTWIDTTGKTMFKYNQPLFPDSNKPQGPEWINEFIRTFLERSISTAPEQWNWSYPGLKAVKTKDFS